LDLKQNIMHNFRTIHVENFNIELYVMLKYLCRYGYYSKNAIGWCHLYTDIVTHVIEMSNRSFNAAGLPYMLKCSHTEVDCYNAVRGEYEVAKFQRYHIT
jgi:hypothetical protein